MGRCSSSLDCAHINLDSVREQVPFLILSLESECQGKKCQGKKQELFSRQGTVHECMLQKATSECYPVTRWVVCFPRRLTHHLRFGCSHKGLPILLVAFY